MSTKIESLPIYIGGNNQNYTFNYSSNNDDALIIGTTYSSGNLFDNDLTTQTRVLTNTSTTVTLTLEQISSYPTYLDNIKIYSDNASRPQEITLKLYDTFDGNPVYSSTITDVTNDLIQGNVFNLPELSTYISKIEFDLYSTNTYIFLSEIEIYQKLTIPDYEFNDSVLSTKSWNSSRYDGKQLQSSQINQYNDNDITYSNTPVLSNYSRTFYIANDIISLNNTSSIDNPYIPGHSYILIDKAITVNDDLSIKTVDIDNFPQNSNGNIKREGFNREFQNNLSVGSEVSLRILDSNSPKKQSSSYPIYLNGGRLQQIIKHNLNSNVISDNSFNYSISNYVFNTLRSGTTDVGDFTLINEPITRIFYTGSIGAKSNRIDVEAVFSNLKSYMDFNPSERFYITLSTASLGVSNNFEPIITNNDFNGNYRTNNLAQISTFEISNITNVSLGQIQGSLKTRLNQNYLTGATTPISTPSSFDTGSYFISYLNQEKPCLLIPLNKEFELPEGGGNSPVVVISENLHPFIKDNLIHFVAKAGLDIGNITTVPSIDNTNSALP